ALTTRRPPPMLAQGKRLMRPLLIFAFVWLSACVAQAGQAKYPQTYNDPLVFGMTKEDVARLIDAPLIYLSGARGSERYLVERMSTVPGFYPVDARLVLQFRRAHLTAWRRDWLMRPYWFCSARSACSRLIRCSNPFN